MKYIGIKIIGLILLSLITFSSCQSKAKKFEPIETTTNIKSEKHIYNDEDTQSNQKENNDKDISVTRENAITRAVQIANPAVVGINVTEVRKVEYRNPFFNDPVFRQFFGGRLKRQYKEYKIEGLGSGFIISPDGYILTNYHVAGNASKIVVTLTSGRKYDAEIIGSDIVSDVALLKIKGNDYPYLKLGNSDDILTGEWVIAFGNPFGLFDINSQPTVTVGVVSNKGVNLLKDQSVYKGMIQTDAAISSGNSGGPLLDANAKVIGMNTVIFSTAQSQQGAGSIGIGFSIPINRIKKIINILKKHKKINRNFVTGVEVRQIDNDIAQYLDTDIKEGVVIYSIKRRSQAEKSGFEPGDIVLSINGHKILRTDDYYINVLDAKAGDILNFVVMRNNKQKELKLYLKPI